jgi:hypothetical protein
MAQLPSGFRTLVSDSFANRNQIFDLSETLLWGNNTSPVSAFQITQQADASGLRFTSISPSDSALAYGSSFTAANSLKTATCFDYRLPTLNRENDSILVEFDALWDTLSQIGEAGRMVLAFLYDYPAEIRFNAISRVNEEAPFGRPAYNIRILNKALNASQNARSAYLFYGGGLDSLGEFEMYSANNVQQWWLPGFIAQPGGQSPQTGPAYPAGPTTRELQFLASSSEWRHFTFKIFPEKLELWMRKTDTTHLANRRMMVMHIPKTSPGRAYTIARLNQLYATSLSALPLHYRWFPHIEAVRFYFRSSNRSYLANVRIAYSGTITTQTLAQNDHPQIYPNPTNLGKVWVSDNQQVWTLKNLQGKNLAMGTISNNQIPLSGIQPGIYMLQTGAANGQTTTQRLIISQ